MRRAILAVIGLVLASGAASGSAFGDRDAELTLLRRGVDLQQANDCPGAAKVMNEVIAAPAFGMLSERQQYAAQRILAACSFDAGDGPTALRMSRLVTARPYADEVDWWVRTLASYASGDNEDASLSLAIVVGRRPDLLHEVEMGVISDIIGNVAGTPAGDARNFAMLKTLFAAKWRPTHEPAENADRLWQRLARYHLAAGEVDAARKVATVIVSPEFVVDARSEKLFDPLVAADPARYDIRLAYEAAAVRLKARAAAMPDKLEPVIELAFLLYQLDRPAEGLALIEDKFTAIKAGKVFADQVDQLNWLYDRRAMLLTALGRNDDAITAFKAGSQIGEGGFNVSQAINLADTYYGFGRPADAIKVLANFDPKYASAFGAMAAEEARVCSYAQLGDKPALTKSLDFVRAHAEDAPGVAVQALLCAGEENEAAALTVKFLGNEKHRDAILERLHTSIEPAKAVNKSFAKLLRGRRLALAKRPEVVKAAETFGHILDLPLVMAW